MELFRVCRDVSCLSRRVIFLGGILSHASGEETLRLWYSEKFCGSECERTNYWIYLYFFCFIHYSISIYGNMKTVIWLCVCEVTVKTDCKVSLASPPRFFCLRGHTHQTGLARSVLSLSSALNGCWSLMWLGCCYCLWHVLISVYWSGKSGHENNWSRPMGRREPIVAESRFLCGCIWHYCTYGRFSGSRSDWRISKNMKQVRIMEEVVKWVKQRLRVWKMSLQL